MNRTRRSPGKGHHRQKGMTLIVVLVLLLVLLMGALAGVRMDETGVLASNNFAQGEAGVQASDVGVNTAFAELIALPTDEGGSNWYFPLQRPTDADGLPQYTAAEWDAARSLTVGVYRVRYLVDRQCNTAPVTDEGSQCLLRQQQTEIVNAGGPGIVPSRLRAYRVTVRVDGPKGSARWVQALVTRG